MMKKKHKESIIGKDSERFGKIRIYTLKELCCSLLVCLFFVVLFGFYSCDGTIETKDQPQKETLTFHLDENVCTDFAVKMHTSLANGDTNFVNSYIDWKSISGSISEDTNYWDATKVEIFNFWKSNISVGEDLIGELVNGNHLRFITYYQLDGEHFIILRNYIEPQTVNYFEFKLNSVGNSIVIADIYDFNKSMLMSQIGKSFCDYYGAHQTNWKFLYTEISKSQLTIEESISNGELQLAYSQLKSMEASYQSTTMFANLRELILLSSDVPSVQANCLFEKSQNIPFDEKGRSLTMFYLNAYAGNYNDALIALANLEDAVGEDGVLDYLKGNLYFEKGEMQQALIAFNDALTYDNEIFSFHIAKVKTLISQSLYTEAVESLLVLDDSFAIKELSWDKEFAEYPEFLISEAYLIWKQRINE